MKRKQKPGRTERALLYLMFSTVSSGMGATVCTAGRFLLVAPLTKPEEELVEGAVSVAPAGKTNKSMQHLCIAGIVTNIYILINLIKL